MHVFVFNENLRHCHPLTHVSLLQEPRSPSVHHIIMTVGHFFLLVMLPRNSKSHAIRMHSGMAFAGNQTFVACAEEIKRYDECARMKICVTGKTTDYGYVASHFTVDFFIVTLSLEESIHSYLNETCNVIGSSRLDLLNYKRQNLRTLTTFIISNETFTNDPLSYVTRPEDSEWSNIANWVVQALFDGERQGITRDESLCENNADLSSDWRQLNFLNAVYCGEYFFIAYHIHTLSC